ncbi:hypothetical protein GCM10010405_46990 [Streptomyces macrosporus]|uniref:Uncharacterized protein n=1 Tax=Streptomyces macrosporus TaxID=44032 RepID=A0ABN3KEP2_9ACTN
MLASGIRSERHLGKYRARMLFPGWEQGRRSGRHGKFGTEGVIAEASAVRVRRAIADKADDPAFAPVYAIERAYAAR